VARNIEVSPRARRREHGTQIVELALVLPLLVILLFLAIEGAGLVRTRQVVVNAARETARLGSLKENSLDPSNMLEDNATCYLLKNGITVPAARVPASCGTSVATPVCSTYSVTITHPVVTKADGSQMNMTRIALSCGYQLRFLPKLSAIGTVVNIGFGAQFRNLY